MNALQPGHLDQLGLSQHRESNKSPEQRTFLGDRMPFTTASNGHRWEAPNGGSRNSSSLVSTASGGLTGGGLDPIQMNGAVAEVPLKFPRNESKISEGRTRITANHAQDRTVRDRGDSKLLSTCQ